MQQIKTGAQVAFQYRQHHLLGGALITGQGTVIGETVVGTERAYVIKPAHGDVVHVRHTGVRTI